MPIQPDHTHKQAFGKDNLSNSLGSKLIKNFLIPLYHGIPERRKKIFKQSPDPLPSTKYAGTNWGYLDDYALITTKKSKTITVYRVLREHVPVVDE